MHKQISPKIIALTFGILVISFLAAFYVVAWQEPTQAPPGGNVPSPINVGTEGQSKAGWLTTLKSFFVGAEPSDAEKETTGVLRTTGGAILNTGGADTGLLVPSGNVGIGTADPKAKLEVVGNVIASVPTADNHVVTKGYVDAAAGGGASYIYAYSALILGSCLACPFGWTSREVWRVDHAACAQIQGGQITLQPTTYIMPIALSSLHGLTSAPDSRSCLVCLCYQ